MRRKDKQIDNQNIINEIFVNSQICTLAIFDKEYPYVIPMNYGFQEGSLYFHCATEGKKIDLIRKNNKVGFIIEQAHEVLTDDISCKWTTKYRSIMGQGEMEILCNAKEKRAGLDIIMKHHGKMKNSYSEAAINKIFVLTLKINSYSAKQSGEW